MLIMFIYMHTTCTLYTYYVLQNVILILTAAVAYLIPDTPSAIIEKIQSENYLTRELIRKTELDFSKTENKELTEEDLVNLQPMAKQHLGRHDDRSEANASRIKSHRKSSWKIANSSVEIQDESNV